MRHVAARDGVMLTAADGCHWFLRDLEGRPFFFPVSQRMDKFAFIYKPSLSAAVECARRALRGSDSKGSFRDAFFFLSRRV
jgi:hypothetical protein